MSIEGVWTTQYLGQNGWENIGALVLQDGRIRGGGRHHYSIGNYSVSGKNLELNLRIEVYGKTQTFFGMKDTSFDLVTNVELDGDTYSGSCRRPDVKGFDMQIRGMKRANLED
jgi:hypothetical protein